MKNHEEYRTRSLPHQAACDQRRIIGIVVIDREREDLRDWPLAIPDD